MSTKKQQDIKSTLVQFYNRPVAKVSLELFFSVMAIIFFAAFAIRPTLVTMSDLIKEIEDKEKLEVQLQRKIAALSAAQTEYHKYQDRLYLLDSALPDTVQLIKTIKIVEKLASENNLVISDLSLVDVPNETEEQQEFTDANMKRLDLEFRLSVMGDFISIRNFVEQLQGSRRTIVVNSLDFRKNENLGTEALQAVMTINIPYLSTK